MLIEALTFQQCTGSINYDIPCQEGYSSVPQETGCGDKFLDLSIELSNSTGDEQNSIRLGGQKVWDRQPDLLPRPLKCSLVSPLGSQSHWLSAIPTPFTEI